MTNQQLFAEKIIRRMDWKTPEIDNHKCILVHHRDPFTQLGPFKIELAYHNPVIMIIHELFTEEDTDYLVDWATPRLSRTRQIIQEEDDGRRPKNEWMYRKTVRMIIIAGSVSKLVLSLLDSPNINCREPNGSMLFDAKSKPRVSVSE